MIHAHNMIYAGLFALEIEEEIGVPVVITEHSSQYAMEGVGTKLEEVLKKSVSRAHTIYAVSPKLVDLLTEKFNLPTNKVKWLANVLDATVEDAPMPTSVIENDNFYWAHVANLIPLKGQKELIGAFATAFENQPKIHLKIAGQGYLEQELKQLVNELGLNDRIEFLGLIKREEVVDLIDRSHALVLPSHYETFGVVLIEALSRGKPVLSTFCGGPECIVNESNGLLVEPKNEQQLANAMSEMVVNYDRFEAVSLRQECLNRFGKQAFYQKLMDIYLG